MSKKLSTKKVHKSVHKKCQQKAEGERKVSGRGAEGGRQGRGRLVAGDPDNSPTMHTRMLLLIVAKTKNIHFS